MSCRLKFCWLIGASRPRPATVACTPTFGQPFAKKAQVSRRSRRAHENTCCPVAPRHLHRLAYPSWLPAPAAPPPQKQSRKPGSATSTWRAHVDFIYKTRSAPRCETAEGDFDIVTGARSEQCAVPSTLLPHDDVRFRVHVLR